LQPVSLGGPQGARVLTGGAVAPLATPKNRPWCWLGQQWKTTHAAWDDDVT